MSRLARSGSPFSLFSFQDIVTSVTGITILLTLILTLELIVRDQSGSSSEAVASFSRFKEALETARSDIGLLEARLSSEAKNVEDIAAVSPELLRRESVALERQIESIRQEMDDIRKREKATHRRLRQVLNRSSNREVDRHTLARLQSKRKTIEEQIERLQSENHLIFNQPPGAPKRAWLIDLADARFQAALLGKNAPPAEFTQSHMGNRVRAFCKWAEKRDPAREYFVLLIRPSGIKAYQQLRERLTDKGFDLGYDVIDENQTVTYSLRRPADS